MNAVTKSWLLLAVLLITPAGSKAQVAAAACEQPVVSVREGKLSVVSNGCSLQQVLVAIGRQTGIEVVEPISAGAVPVAASFGPGNPARVISEVLDGSPFNCTLITNASGALAKVVLTERVVPLVLEKPTVVAAQSADSTNDQKAPKDEKGKSDVAVASKVDDLQAEQPQARPDIDEATLNKLPQLPAGIPAAMWKLFPDVVRNGGVVPSGAPTLPNGQPLPALTTSSPTAVDTQSSSLDPAFMLKGAVGLPSLPPWINPAIAKLYPVNLMQLVQSPVTSVLTTIPPLAEPIPVRH